MSFTDRLTEKFGEGSFTLSEFREMIATRGDDLVALGRDLQMSRATLYRLLRRAGIRKPRKKRGLPPSV